MKRIIFFILSSIVFAIQAQEVSTFVGNGINQYLDGTGINSSFTYPHSLVIDNKQNIYVADNYKIRKITPEGLVSTFVGNVQGYKDGIGKNASFRSINGMAIDKTGNLFVADGSTIRKISTDSSVVTLKGSDNTPINGNVPTYYCVIVDDSGIIYAVQGPVAFDPGYKLLKIATDGSTSTITLPGAISDLAFDNKGNLFATTYFSVIKIYPNGGYATIAGSTNFNCCSGFKDDLGVNAMFYEPQGLTVDSKGNIFIADTHNQRIRKITRLGQVTTVAGIGTRGDVDGPAFECNFDYPHDVVIDSLGNLYVGDVSSGKIRKINMPQVTTGIEKSDNANFEIFPNPTSQNLTINSSLLYDSYNVSNQTGNEIGSGKIEGENINVEQLKAGVYFIKLLSKTGESVVRKFVKQ
jgi:hypothetical protein